MTVERFDIVSVIRGVLQSMDIMIQQKEAKVSFNADKPVYVWADEFKIEEVVTNYTSNALNHLDGEKEIEIRVFTEGDHVKVTVFNTGRPIPEADVPNLWNKFYKVDKARTREYGGVVLVCRLSRQSWKDSISNTVSKTMTMVLNSGSH